jgi:hypothetical protein
MGGTPSTPAGGAAPVLTEEEQKNVHKCKNFLMTLIQLAQELVFFTDFLPVTDTARPA